MNLEALKREGRRFVVVTTPQRSSKRCTGLTEISEEFAEDEEENEENIEGEEADKATPAADACIDVAAEISNGKTKENGFKNGKSPIKLNCSDDPLKRFQVQSSSL